MKLDNLITEGHLFENIDLAEETVLAIHEMENMLEAVQYASSLLKENKLTNDEKKELSQLVSEMEEYLSDDTGILDLFESVDRQFRRYGDKFMRQYRCTSGDKSGRMVSSPEKCGIRKDPRRVRIGKRSARVKKGQRVRKTKFTKRKTQSKRLSRLNKIMRGDS